MLKRIFQAHGLANFCATKDLREIRNKLVYDIETSWYKGNHPLSYCEYKELASRHKQLLEDLRERTRVEFFEPMLLEIAIDVKSIFRSGNIHAALPFAETVFIKSKALCEKLICPSLWSPSKSNMDQESPTTLPSLSWDSMAWSGPACGA